MESKQGKSDVHEQSKLMKQLLILDKKVETLSSGTISVLLGFVDYQALESKRGFWLGIVNFSAGLYASAILTFYTFFEGTIPMEILQITTFLFVFIVFVSLIFSVIYQRKAGKVSKQMDEILETIYGPSRSNSK